MAVKIANAADVEVTALEMVGPIRAVASKFRMLTTAGKNTPMPANSQSAGDDQPWRGEHERCCQPEHQRRLKAR